MDIHIKIAEKIIKEQENIIGPVAIEQAKKVPGLNVDVKTRKIIFEGNETEILESLIEQYKELFGQASVEACRDAVKGIIDKIPKDEIPPLLR